MKTISQFLGKLQAKDRNVLKVTSYRQFVSDLRISDSTKDYIESLVSSPLDIALDPPCYDYHSGNMKACASKCFTMCCIYRKVLGPKLQEYINLGKNAAALLSDFPPELLNNYEFITQHIFEKIRGIK